MAYTAPPTFTAGSVLSAAQMNILSDDVEYLYGKVGGPVPAVNAHVVTDGTDAYYAFRYKWRYLLFKFNITGSSTHIKVYIEDGSGSEKLVWNDDSSPDEGVRYGTVDFLGTAVYGPDGGAAMSLTMSTGDIYKLHLDWNNGASASLSFYYFINSDSDTL